MKRITAIIFALIMTLTACGETPWAGGHNDRVDVPEEDIYDPNLITIDDIEDKVNDLSNLFNLLYNNYVPLLYVKLPQNDGYNTKPIDNFIKKNFIDTIEAETSDPKAIVKAIVDLMPKYYGLLEDGSAANKDGYYGGDGIRPSESYEYKLRAYGESSGNSNFSGKYDEMTDKLASYSDSEKTQITYTCYNDYGIGTKLMLIHNLDDTSFIKLLGDNFGTVTVYDIRKFDSETLISNIRDSINYDLCITLIDQTQEYPRLNKGKDVVNMIFLEDNSSIPVKDNNRMLQVVYKDADIAPHLKNMKEFRKTVNDMGGEVLYVQSPFKVLKGITILPESDDVQDFANHTADKFLEGCKNEGIPYIDLRKGITEALPVDKIFFKTDHHWKPEAAFWGYTQIINFLRDEWGWDVNPNGYFTDPDNFVFETHENYFYSHLAKKYTHQYVGIDDFTLIYPKFDTDYIYTLNNNGDISSKSGPYRTALFNEYYLRGDDPAAYNRYAAYLDGDRPLITVTNNDPNASDKKVLVLKDSFANAFNTLFSLNFKELNVMDLRHYKLSTLTEYVQANDYDLIIFFYTPTMYSTNPIMFKFK